MIVSFVPPRCCCCQRWLKSPLLGAQYQAETKKYAFSIVPVSVAYLRLALCLQMKGPFVKQSRLFCQVNVFLNGDAELRQDTLECEQVYFKDRGTMRVVKPRQWKRGKKKQCRLQTTSTAWKMREKAFKSLVWFPGGIFTSAF